MFTPVPALAAFGVSLTSLSSALRVTTLLLGMLTSLVMFSAWMAKRRRYLAEEKLADAHLCAEEVLAEARAEAKVVLAASERAASARLAASSDFVATAKDVLTARL